MPERSDEETRRVIADQTYWVEIGSRHGWQLAGWTDREHALFRKDNEFFEVNRHVATALAQDQEGEPSGG